MHKTHYLLGVDVGTGSVKAALFDSIGSMVGFGQYEYKFTHQKPMWSELQPETVWEQMLRAIKDCIGSGNVSSRDITGIGFSCIGDTGIALDDSGNPLYPAIESTDQRANAYSEYVHLVDSLIGSENIYKHTGYPLSSLPPILKILWLRDNCPLIYTQMARYASFQEYLIWKMTGQPSVDYSLASRTMAFDIFHKKWITEFLDKLSISDKLFSKAVPSSRIVGYLLNDVSNEMGVPSGLPVVTGAHDQCCNAMGLGILNSNVVGDGTGSVEALVRITDNPQTSDLYREQGIGCQCYALENKYLSIAFHLTAGSLVRWYRDQFGKAEVEIASHTGKDAYDLLTERANTSPPGANGLMVLPHFLGSGTCRKPPLDSASRGALLGLSLSHTKNDITRAIFEGITYETKYLLDGLASSGEEVDTIVATGGAAKSDFWMQLKADITGKRVIIPEITETSCLGAAILAGMGTGVYENYADAASRACHFKREFTPDYERFLLYQKYYEIYRDVYDSVIGINSRLAEL